MRCVWEGGEFCYAIASLLALYVGTVLRYSFKHHGSIAAAIALRFENLNLLNEVKSANRALQFEIAERMQAEANLRVILESTADGILAVDAAGRIIQTNRKFIELWKLPPSIAETGDDAAMLNFILDQLVDPDGFLEKVKTLYGTAEMATDVLAFKDGRVFERFSAPLMRENSVIGRVWSFRDITERKRAEKQREELENQLRQAQKMEAIGSLAGGIAHDFNNILAAVIGNVELARLNEGATCVADELNESIRAAIRAKDLVKQILAFSRQTTAETMPVRASIVAREALKFMRATIPSSIEIQSRIDEASGSVLSNSVELHQIIMNLCTNAVHAIGSQAGLLEIDVQSVRIDPPMKKGDLAELECGPHVRISVKDSGQGMSPEVMARIFDPYFTTKDKEIGTGLGLAVVHGIVKKNSGAITVRSTVGKGTAFDVYLPAVAVSAPARAERDRGIALGDSERILLVDDEKMLVDIGQQILRRLGYAVVARTSPIEALELFKAKPGYFDLVITDQTMPGMTGDALARELIRLRPGLPVIICTGYSQTIDEKRAAAMGVSGLVMKPMLITEISAAVRKALGQAAPGTAKCPASASPPESDSDLPGARCAGTSGFEIRTAGAWFRRQAEFWNLGSRCDPQMRSHQIINQRMSPTTYHRPYVVIPACF